MLDEWNGSMAARNPCSVNGLCSGMRLSLKIISNRTQALAFHSDVVRTNL